MSGKNVPITTNVRSWEDVIRALQQIVQRFKDNPYISAKIFDANTVLKADSDNTPEALEMGEQTILGRVTGGDIDALTLRIVIGDPGSDSEIPTVKAVRDALTAMAPVAGKASWAEFLAMAGLP